MADADPKDVAGGMNKKLILLVILALAVLGGGGGTVWFLMGGEEKGKKSNHAEPVEEADSHIDEIGPVVDLEPFVLNLADREQLRYLKVSIKLQLDRPKDQTDFDVRLPAIRDALLVLLTSKESRALRTVEGKMLVRDEIGGRVNTIMKQGKITNVFFTDFIIQ